MGAVGSAVPKNQQNPEKFCHLHKVPARVVISRTSFAKHAKTCALAHAKPGDGCQAATGPSQQAVKGGVRTRQPKSDRRTGERRLAAPYP